MQLRVATFNLENFDDKSGEVPTLQQRIELIRPQLVRLNADILCLQEVNGQETVDNPRELLALKKLLEKTQYEGFHVESTRTVNNEVYDERNLVIVSRFEITDLKQYRNDNIDAPRYSYVTEKPHTNDVKEIKWERPILYAVVEVNDNFTLHVLNLHLKSRLPVDVSGQKKDRYTWKSSAGWAEGYFVSSMKRVGQALETRIIIDHLFEEINDPKILVCGDFNAHPGEVPVEAISGRTENTGNKDLNNQVLLSCENSLPQSSRFTYIHQGERRLLDHILISKALLPYYQGAEIHNESLHDESIAFAKDEKYPESDHAPFIVEFEI